MPNPSLERFANTRGVAVRTWRQRHTPWSGGVALAAWPTRDKLGEIADSPGVRGLVVVPWAAGEVDAWVAAANPDRLGPAAAKAPPAAPGTGLDPVVVEGLKTLSIMVNHANNLAGSLDRRDAVAVLRTLNKAGYRLPPEPVYSWAMANGWPARGAERLRNLAEAYEQGRRPQLKGEFPLRADILDQWRSRVS